MNFSKAAFTVGSALGVRDLIEAVEGLELQDLLGTIGLERRPATLARLLPATGLVAISAAVGAGVALLLAPSSGSELRARLSDGLGDAKHRLNDSLKQLEASSSSKRAIS